MNWLILKKRPQLTVFLFYTVLFVCLSVFALTFVYTEGDDASTIIYHLFGQNDAIQKSFNSYHSGFDSLLSVLPNSEKALRTTSFLFSFVAGFTVLGLLSFSLFQLFRNDRVKVMYFSILLPFILPELLFSSLIVNPTLIGFVFCLFALLCSQLYFFKKQVIYLWLIPFCFLIGVPFRWSLLIFIPVLLGFWFYNRKEKFLSIKLLSEDVGYFTALFFSVILSFLGIWISGYNPKDVLEVMIWGSSYSTEAEVAKSLSMLVANGLSFFTPAMGVLLIFGLVSVLKKKEYSILMFVLFSVVPFFFLGFDLSLKFLITLLPALLLLIYGGFSYLFPNRAAMAAVGILVAIPWLFGLELSTKGADYGPRFEIANWQSSSNTTKKAIDGKENVPDTRLQVLGGKIILASGFAMPTVEGPRPIFGYLWAFFGGGWKGFLTEIEDERADVFNRLAKKKKSVLLQEKRFDSFECFLFSKKFSCVKIRDIKGSHYERTYQKGDQVIKIIVPKRSSTHEEMCTHLQNFKPDVVYTSSTSNAQNISFCSDFKRISPFALILSGH